MIEKAFIIISSLNYGDIITHTQISEWIGVTANSSKYRSEVTKLRNKLLKDGKAIESVYKVGYKLVNPDDYAGTAINQYRLGFNRLSKGEEILQYAPTKNMTQEGLANYNKVADKAQQLHASLAGGIVELNLLNRKKEHPFLT